MKFRVIDGCPVPLAIADEVEELRRRSGSGLNSVFRGDEAEGLLRRLKKSTQRMLFDGFARGLPGFNPANPPKGGTHECYSDGVAYPGPRGRRLRDWQCGTDWADPGAVDRAAREIGVVIFRPYPDSREAQHRNFLREPRWRPAPKPLTRNSRGPRVGALTGWLAYLGYPVKRTGRFDGRVERAVKRYQGRHSNLADDGVAGPKTVAQIRAGVRGKKRARRAAKGIKSPAQRKARLRAIDRKYGPQ